jgi:hypothetical protein
MPKGEHYIFAREFFGVAIRVWWTGGEYWPHWAYSVDGLDYCGVPNKCNARQAAILRAWWRAKWTADGSIGQRYRPWPPEGKRQFDF